MTTLENRFPLLAVEHGCIISKDADITVAFEVELPELYTVTGAEYEAIHSCWCKAIKVLPDYSVVHKQDWFIKERYKPELQKDDMSFLSRSFERHFNERPYLKHTCYLYLTKTTKERNRMQSNFSTLCRGHIIPKELDRETTTKFLEACEQFERIMNDSGLVRLRRLSTDEIVGTEGKTGLIERYFSLMPEGDTTLQDIELSAREMRIGDNRLCLHTLSDAEDLPGKVATDTRYEKLSTDRSDCRLSFASPVGLLLSCNHIYNQYVLIDNSEETLQKFEKSARNMQSLSRYSRSNSINREWIDQYLNEAHSYGTYYKAFAISFTDPWMGGRKPNSFTISAHYSDENNAYYAWQKGTRYFRTAGVAAGLGKRLDWPDPYFTFYAEASYERYMLKDWNTFVLKNGAANLLSIRLVLGRNSVDQPIYPRRGSDFSVSVQLTPPYSLWDGKDYKSTALSEQERYNWIEFHKWMLKGQWFTPLTRNGNLVLMARAEMGYLGHYNKNKVSPFERFEVGGDGMTGYNMYGIDIISMRGYDDGALDPVGSNYSCAYNKYTMELRYPLLLKGQTNIYVLGFLEGGNGFTSWKEFSPFKIKRSAGIGVRLFLPVVGMVGVDWGWGFDPAAGQTKRSGSHIHFTMGMQF